MFAISLAMIVHAYSAPDKAQTLSPREAELLASVKTLSDEWLAGAEARHEMGMMDDLERAAFESLKLWIKGGGTMIVI